MLFKFLEWTLWFAWSNNFRYWQFFFNIVLFYFQANLVCSRPEDALPCEESANYFNVNENFGKIPEKN
jgi:hypothetical protein